MKEENVTTVASNSKLLPLSKIVSARKFKKLSIYLIILALFRWKMKIYLPLQQEL